MRLLTVQVALSVLLSAMAPIGASENADQPGSLVVTVGVGTFSVVAESVTLGEILECLSTQVGFQLVEHVDTRSGRVTLELPPISWTEGIGILLEGWRYALAVDSQSGVPKNLVILSWDEGQASERISAIGQPSTHVLRVPDDTTDSLEEATRIAGELVRVRERDLVTRALDDVRREARALAEFERQLRPVPDASEGVLEDARQHRERYVARYAESILALGSFTDPEQQRDPRVLDVLRPAVSADEAPVRMAALSALRWRGVEAPEVLEDIRSLITSDPEPGVRREALEVYAAYGEVDRVLRLVRTLGRSANPVQDIAVREWLRIEREREADEQAQLEEVQ